MKTEKLNILPSPTFAHLGANYAVREVSSGEPNSITLSRGGVEISGSTRCTVNAAKGKQTGVTQFISAKKAITLDTDVTLEEGAHLTLVQVFGRGCGVVSRLSADVADNAKLDLIQLYIGGDTVSEIKAQLRGYRSELAADIAYTLDGSDRLDLNLVAEHRGRKSVSGINAGGVMNGSADKVFKGTIDFKSGASGAKGTESEDVLLIGDSVRSRTLPVILCSEEDVEGSHGATAGRIGEDKLFYMRSRGFSEEQITRLMSRSKLSRVIKLIKDDVIKRRVYSALGWGDDDE